MSDPNTPAEPGPRPADQQPQPGSYQPGYQQPPPGYSQPGYQQPPPGYSQPGYAQPQQPGGVTQQDEKTWAMLGHIGGILISFVAGLIVYLVYKDRSAYLKQQGAEALNFQITVAIAYVAASVLSVIGIGLLLIPVVWIVAIVFGIIAGLAANRHENYRYPIAIRFVK
ncbi:DUF4870 domain-containing protein [Aquipuribacter sp. SD81]|uniref:DUF4870 domain-containing protein n=1 Tax=Aquipuribacter sp. SD81 TaxID=3127703 RepID=UPI00301AEA6F